MLIKFQITQTINYPADKTFAFLSDYTHMPLWNYYIQSVTKISEGPVGVGTLFNQIRPRDNYNLKVITYQLNQKVIFELQPPGPLTHYGFEMKEQGAQTQVTLISEINLDGYSVLKYLPGGKLKDWLLSFAEKAILAKTKPAVAQNFEKLKILLETGEVTLQSGKHVVLK